MYGGWVLNVEHVSYDHKAIMREGPRKTQRLESWHSWTVELISPPTYLWTSQNASETQHTICLHQLLGWGLYYCCLVTKSCLTLLTPWTVGRQAPLSMGFPRQEYWSGLPFPSPGDLSDPKTKATSPELAGGLFTTEPSGKPGVCIPWQQFLTAIVVQSSD